jgi:hypothetical protein
MMNVPSLSYALPFSMSGTSIAISYACDVLPYITSCGRTTLFQLSASLLILGIVQAADESSP